MRERELEQLERYEERCWRVEDGEEEPVVSGQPRHLEPW